MSIQLYAAAFDFAAVKKIFSKRREKAAAEVDGFHWANLFGTREYDDDGYRMVIAPEKVTALRATLADLIAGRPIGEHDDHTWEDVFFALCVKHGVSLPTEFLDRIGPGTIKDAEDILVSHLEIEPGFLEAAIFRSPPPLPLPAATPGLNLGFIPVEQINEWSLLFYDGTTFESGDREALGGAVQIRSWIQRASHQYSILLLLN